jgi:hypothetical protein
MARDFGTEDTTTVRSFNVASSKRETKTVLP